MMTVLDNPILVLNKSWYPIDSDTIRNSLATVMSERAVYLKTPDFTKHSIKSWMNLSVDDGGSVIRHARGVMNVPELMLLTEFSIVPKRVVVFNRRNLWQRDKRRCQYCGQEPPLDAITIDHILPKSKGGLSTFENCVLACIKCNLKKGSRTLGAAGMSLRKLKRNKAGQWTTVLYDVPKHPQWNPLYALKRKRFPKSWAAFLRNFDESLYWEVELEE